MNKSFLIQGNMLLYNAIQRKTLIETTYWHWEIYKSLLPTLYKVFSHCLCNRIITLVSNEIAFWQRTYLEKRDRQELIFLLKTEIDNFRQLSTKMIVTFIDFIAGFGSVSHDIIFKCLERFNIPPTYIEIIKDLYGYSSFQVLGATSWSKAFS